MSKQIRLLINIILYLYLALAAICIIGYFNGLYIIEDFPIVQLIAGVVLLFMSIMITLIVATTSRKVKSLAEDTLESTEFTEKEKKPVAFEEKVEVSSEMNQTEVSNEIVAEEVVPEIIEQPVEEDSDNSVKSEENANIEEFTFTIEDINVETSQTESVQQEIVNDGDLLSSLVSHYHLDDIELSNDQISFINNSENSYINEDGLPQLRVTEVIDFNEVESALDDVKKDELTVNNEPLIENSVLVDDHDNKEVVFEPIEDEKSYDDLTETIDVEQIEATLSQHLPIEEFEEDVQETVEEVEATIDDTIIPEQQLVENPEDVIVNEVVTQQVELEETAQQKVEDTSTISQTFNLNIDDTSADNFLRNGDFTREDFMEEEEDTYSTVLSVICLVLFVGVLLVAGYYLFNLYL